VTTPLSTGRCRDRQTAGSSASIQIDLSPLAPVRVRTATRSRALPRQGARTHRGRWWSTTGSDSVFGLRLAARRRAGARRRRRRGRRSRRRRRAAAAEAAPPAPRTATTGRRPARLGREPRDVRPVADPAAIGCTPAPGALVYVSRLDGRAPLSEHQPDGDVAPDDAGRDAVRLRRSRRRRRRQQRRHGVRRAADLLRRVVDRYGTTSPCTATTRRGACGDVDRSA
jgi:hypothetical protein